MKQAITTAFLATIALGFLVPAALGEECMVSIAADEDRGTFGELVFYSFDPMIEVQIETPTQPSDLSFMIAIDGVESSDIMAFPGLDDLLLSLAPPDGDIAIDLDFVSRLVAGEELAIFGLRDGAVVTSASYDLPSLREALVECGFV